MSNEELFSLLHHTVKFHKIFLKFSVKNCVTNEFFLVYSTWYYNLPIKKKKCNQKLVYIPGILYYASLLSVCVCYKVCNIRMLTLCAYVNTSQLNIAEHDDKEQLTNNESRDVSCWRGGGICYFPNFPAIEITIS